MLPMSTPPESISLPAHLPAMCFVQPAVDYQVPEVVLVALVKVESRGQPIQSKRNSNGTVDLGVAQINSASWAPYLQTKYGITADSLLKSPCQGIRAAAYVLRKEMNHKKCGGVNVWCAVGRYHAPSDESLARAYALKVSDAMVKIMREGHF